MQETRTEPLGALVQRFTDYLPTLAAGLLVLALGLVLGWLAKRAVIRVLIWLRLDRLAGRVGWRSALGKGDARAAVYDLMGNLALSLVALIFLDNALTIWGLAVLSRLLDSLVFSLPRIALAALIVAVGITVSTAAAERARDALEDEGLAHAGLLGKGLKAMLLAIVAALGLWELNFARQIVLSGFIIAFGAMGIAFALSVGLGSSRAIQRAWDELFQNRKDRSE
jgi:Mechanosensitive ion channel, conserved TM helix